MEDSEMKKVAHEASREVAYCLTYLGTKVVALLDSGRPPGQVVTELRGEVKRLGLTGYSKPPE